jgi:hypothetical protein
MRPGCELDRSLVLGQSQMGRVLAWWQRLSITWLDYGAIGMIGLLGILRLPEPLWGDQALFLLAGKAIQSGAMLYRDFWDVKQPGIYGVFTLAGAAFGFDEIGAHLFDGLWMLTLAIGLRVTLAQAFSRPWIGQILPWMTVGTYFAMIDARQQMQVESLVGLPLYFVVWCCLQATRQPDRQFRWLTLAGIMGGIVLLFKLIYLPLLVAFWFIYLLHRVIRQKEPIFGVIWRSFWPLCLGVMLPIVPVVIYWGVTGTLDIAVYTMIQHPPKMVQFLLKKPIQALADAIGWSRRKFFPLLVLSGFGIVYSGRRWQGLKGNLLTVYMLAWLGLGFGMILAQSQSWWNYHFLLFLVPLSVLAAQGVDYLLQQRQRWQRLVVAGCLGWLVVANLMTVGWVTALKLRSGFDFSFEGRQRYHALVSSRYQSAIAETQFLKEPGSLPGDVYVIGEPIFYLLADRAQAVPLIGWISEMLLPEQWTELQAQLTAAQPPYVFVAADHLSNVSPRFMQFLTGMYKPLRQSDAGVWYQLDKLVDRGSK